MFQLAGEEACADGNLGGEATDYNEIVPRGKEVAKGSDGNYAKGLPFHCHVSPAFFRLP
jgi:hypothetical protein